MIEVGKHTDLEIVKETDFGVYLSEEDFGEEEILLPMRYVPTEAEVGDIINVFVYRDSEDRIIATTLVPDAVVGEFAYLKVDSATKTGAFMEWGLPKDLLVPFTNQKRRMEAGRWYLVYLYLDKVTDRVVGTSKIGKYIEDIDPEMQVGDEVSILVAGETEIGYRVIVENKYLGLLYKSEIFKGIKPGHKGKAYIKKFREDNRMDLSLQPVGYVAAIPDASDKILLLMGENEGELMLTDKSSPEEIYSKLEMSKKNFKKAVGRLFREKKILILEDRLVRNDD